jgi:hypothetical protein
MAAFPIEPQQMIPQLRQFFLLAQRPDITTGECGWGFILVHVKTPLG